MRKRIVWLIMLVWLYGAVASTSAQKYSGLLHTFDLRSPDDLQALLPYGKDRVPLVSAHRGGARQGFPEKVVHKM